MPCWCCTSRPPCQDDTCWWQLPCTLPQCCSVWQRGLPHWGAREACNRASHQEAQLSGCGAWGRSVGLSSCQRRFQCGPDTGISFSMRSCGRSGQLQRHGAVAPNGSSQCSRERHTFDFSHPKYLHEQSVQTRWSSNILPSLRQPTTPYWMPLGQPTMLCPSWKPGTLSRSETSKSGTLSPLTFTAWMEKWRGTGRWLFPSHRISLICQMRSVWSACAWKTMVDTMSFQMLMTFHVCQWLRSQNPTNQPWTTEDIIFFDMWVMWPILVICAYSETCTPLGTKEKALYICIFECFSKVTSSFVKKEII